MAALPSLGLVGGGALGGAIARAALRAGVVAPETLWIASRSGEVGGFEAWPGVNVTTQAQDLARHCQTILLAVPPDQVGAVGLRAPDALVVSVMAGVTLDRLARETGAHRVVRAMSSPVAEIALAYSPWRANEAVDEADRATVRTLFEACGTTDEIDDEDQLNFFTAMTGPVPGFVAFVADAMIASARKHGVEPAIAQRAARQLFLGAGTLMNESEETPADAVQAMIDYAGATATGLLALRETDLVEAIDAGLDAAARRAREMG